MFIALSHQSSTKLRRSVMSAIKNMPLLRSLKQFVMYSYKHSVPTGLLRTISESLRDADGALALRPGVRDVLCRRKERRFKGFPGGNPTVGVD